MVIAMQRSLVQLPRKAHANNTASCFGWTRWPKQVFNKNQDLHGELFRRCMSCDFSQFLNVSQKRKTLKLSSARGLFPTVNPLRLRWYHPFWKGLIYGPRKEKVPGESFLLFFLNNGNYNRTLLWNVLHAIYLLAVLKVMCVIFWGSIDTKQQI